MPATLTPTPAGHLEDQLQDGLSVPQLADRSKALLLVAEDAVLHEDYWTAIRAADATPWGRDQAANLGFVVRCAIEDGLFNMASEAANRVRWAEPRSSLTVQVIAARKQATLKAVSVQANREALVCFDSGWE